MSAPKPPPLPSTRNKSAQNSITPMEQAFALTSDPTAYVELDVDPDADDDALEADVAIDVDATIARLRREQLAKYVKATMAASLVILVLAFLRSAVGITPEEEIAAASTFVANVREVPAQTAAALPRVVDTLSSRTEAALRFEKRREASRAPHQGVMARAKAFW